MNKKVKKTEPTLVTDVILLPFKTAFNLTALAAFYHGFQNYPVLFNLTGKKIDASMLPDLVCPDQPSSGPVVEGDPTSCYLQNLTVDGTIQLMTTHANMILAAKKRPQITDQSKISLLPSVVEINLNGSISQVAPVTKFEPVEVNKFQPYLKG